MNKKVDFTSSNYEKNKERKINKGKRMYQKGKSLT